MNTQTLDLSPTYLDLLAAAARKAALAAWQVAPRPEQDFYEDEAELAAELAAAAEATTSEPAHAIEPDEFESAYCWFLA